MAHIRGKKPEATVATVHKLPSARRQRLKPDEPPIPKSEAAPLPPPWLDDHAAEIFVGIVEHMQSAGLVPLAVDGYLITALVIATSAHREAAKRLNAENLVITTRKGPRRNPWLMVLNQQSVIIDRLTGSLKIAMSDRDRVRPPAVKSTSELSFAEHLARL